MFDESAVILASYEPYRIVREKYSNPGDYFYDGEDKPTRHFYDMPKFIDMIERSLRGEFKRLIIKNLDIIKNDSMGYEALVFVLGLNKIELVVLDQE